MMWPWVLLLTFTVFIMALVAGAALAQYLRDRRTAKTGDFLLEANR